VHNSLNEYIFLIDGEERLAVSDYSLYSAKKRAKKIAGAGIDLELIETRKGFKPRKEKE